VLVLNYDMRLTDRFFEFSWLGYLYPWSSSDPWTDRLAVYRIPANVSNEAPNRVIEPAAIKYPEGRKMGFIQLKVTLCKGCLLNFELIIASLIERAFLRQTQRRNDCSERICVSSIPRRSWRSILYQEADSV